MPSFCRLEIPLWTYCPLKKSPSFILGSLYCTIMSGFRSHICLYNFLFEWLRQQATLMNAAIFSPFILLLPPLKTNDHNIKIKGHNLRTNIFVQVIIQKK